MVYVTGDTHGDLSRFAEINMRGESKWAADDVIIVCGDFGFLFLNNSFEESCLNELEKKPYTICFVDGNHENFSAIFEYPCEEWNGGKIHRIRKNIIHLMRGQVFNIQGKKIFTFGGAYSIDRAEKKLQSLYWKEELPSDKELDEATKNLQAHDMKVDYIITHTAPQKIIRLMGYVPNEHDSCFTNWLEWIMEQVEFKKWFFGHWHIDKEITDKFRAMLNDVVTIDL